MEEQGRDGEGRRFQRVLCGDEKSQIQAPRLRKKRPRADEPGDASCVRRIERPFVGVGFVSGGGSMGRRFWPAVRMLPRFSTGTYADPSHRVESVEEELRSPLRHR